MSENRATKPVTNSSPRRYNVVLTGSVRKGFDPEQVVVELSQLAKIDVAQAKALLGGAARVVKSNVDQNTATQFQTRFEGIGAQCIIKAVSSAPVERLDGATETPSKTLNTLTIKDAFDGELPPDTNAQKFPMGLLPVILMMLVLPLLYVAVTGVLTYHTAWHVLNNYDWLLEPPYAMNAVWYVVPSVLGTALVLSLLKPLLVPVVSVRRTVKMEKRDDGLFFSFVDQIAQRSGLPMPAEIEVDCAASASARQTASGHVVLTLGLPLAGALSARQLAAVVAHALGRHVERRGNFLWRSIRGLHEWWYRCVNERDVLDIKRDEWIAAFNDYRTWLLRATRGFDWIARKVLWVFLQLDRQVSRGALQQLEKDADRYAVGFGGAAAFAQLLQRIHELAAADSAVQQRLATQHSEGKLSDHLPKAIVELANKLPVRYRDAVTEAMDLPQGAAVLTDRARIENAEQGAPRALFVSDAPATEILVGYDRLSRQASLAFYRHRFDPSIKPEHLVSVVDTVAQTEPVAVSEEHLKSYFGNQFTVTRFLNIRRQVAFAAPDPVETKRRLDLVVQQLRQNLKAYAQALACYREDYAALLTARAARTLAESEIAFTAAEFNVDGVTVADADRAIQQTTGNLQTQQPELAKFESSMTQRFELALAMRPDGKTQNDIHKYQSALGVIAAMHDSVTDLRAVALALQQVVRVAPTTDGAVITARCRSHYEKILAVTATAPYPLESHAKDAFKTIADYLRSYCGSPEQFETEPALLIKRIDNIRKCAEFLHESVMIRLAAIAVDVENKLGVDSLQQSRATAKLPDDDIALPF